MKTKTKKRILNILNYAWFLPAITAVALCPVWFTSIIGTTALYLSAIVVATINQNKIDGGLK